MSQIRQSAKVNKRNNCYHRQGLSVWHRVLGCGFECSNWRWSLDDDRLRLGRVIAFWTLLMGWVLYSNFSDIHINNQLNFFYILYWELCNGCSSHSKKYVYSFSKPSFRKAIPSSRYWFKVNLIIILLEVS